MAPKIAVIYYSTHGHIQTLAQAEAKGIRESGGTCDIYQIAETLSSDVLQKIHAAPKAQDIPVLADPATLEQYDGFLFGISTRYGNFPAQWKVFWDNTARIWKTGGYHAKFAGVFVASGTQGGGQESTAVAAISTLTHHGIIYVPLGYKATFALLGDVSEVRGGSPWGAGTFSAGNGSRQPSAKELELASTQGAEFYKLLSKVDFGAK